MATKERIIPAHIAEDGSVHYTSFTSPPDDSIAVCYMVPDRVIPVIFVPGVMGSNLENKRGAIVWDVSDQTSLLGWSMKNPVERKTILDPNKVSASAQGSIPAGSPLSDAEKQRRGWTTVSKLYYGDFLVWLEESLNDSHPGTNYGKDGLRDKLIDQVIAPGLAPVTDDEVNLTYRYQFPVHAVGYNWLQSNALSAKTLASKIDEFTSFYRNKYGWRCDKVILVTHSMGGLVARYLSEAIEEGRDRILGIVHGVMPATGAAAAYQHVRAGNWPAATSGILDSFIARTTSRVLGATAAEVAPVFAQSPGPLQLLPCKDYGMGWLKIYDGNQWTNLPKADPYEEIYTQRGKWWGLINEALIDPEKKQPREMTWLDFTSQINEQVFPFHDAIAKAYHANTYAFCGDDDLENLKTWGNVVWKRASESRYSFPSKVKPLYYSAEDAKRLGLRNSHVLSQLSEPKQSELDKPMFNDDNSGQILVEDTKLGSYASYASLYKLQPATDSGDGTVPGHSGRAPRWHTKAFAAFKGIEHAGAYAVKPQMTQPQQFSLWAIVKMVQHVKGTSMAYADWSK